MDIPRQFEGMLFHVSKKKNREDIEDSGIEPSVNDYERFNEETGDYEPVRRVGIYVTKTPSTAYGKDIWGIDLKNNGIKESELDNSHQKYKDDYFLGRGVSDVKRVGHFYKTPNGQTEVHWHKEEECPNERS